MKLLIGLIVFGVMGTASALGTNVLNLNDAVASGGLAIDSAGVDQPPILQDANYQLQPALPVYN